MLFALIRRMNGYNNNPTTIQFKSAYRKLLLNNLNVTISTSANCTPQDATLMLSNEPGITDLDDTVESDNTNDKSYIGSEENRCSTKNAMSSHKTKGKSSLHELLAQLCDYRIFEHSYSGIGSWCASDYVEDIVKHVAGFIVRSVKQRIDCEKCVAMLLAKNLSEPSKLSTIKNRGGLIFASDDVIYVCMKAEKTLRNNKHAIFVPNVMQKLLMETIAQLPSTIFDEDTHSLEQEPLYDHRYQLILRLLKKYFNVRLNYESSLVNEETTRIRMRNNKNTLFSGQ